MRFRLSGIAIGSEARTLVFGTVADLGQRLESPPLENVTASWAVALRLKPSGELDPTFGEGKGFVRSDFGLPTDLSLLPSPDFPTASILAGSVDSQGRPVLLVGTDGRYSPCYGHSWATAFPRAVVRLTMAGALDPSFGAGDGISPLDGSPLVPQLGFAMGDQPVAIVGVGNCPNGPTVFRFDSNGGPLADFGAGGVRFYPKQLLDGVVEPSGGLILRIGRPTERVTRIAPDGARDRGFGEDGVATVTMPPGARRSLRPVGVDEQGRVLLAGALGLPKPRRPAHGKRSIGEEQSRGFIVVGRLSATGNLDHSFGKRGWIITPFGGVGRVIARQAALDRQNRLVVLAAASSPNRQQNGYVLLRYRLGAQ